MVRAGVLRGCVQGPQHGATGGGGMSAPAIALDERRQVVGAGRLLGALVDRDRRPVQRELFNRHEIQRAALRIVRREDELRQEFHGVIVDYAKRTPEWSRTLTNAERDRWHQRLTGYADAVVELVVELVEVDPWTVADVVYSVAFGCARFSHGRGEQRARAYKRAAKVREGNADRDAGIIRDRAAGVSQRKLAARYGLSRAGVRHILSTANRPPPALWITRPPPARATANRPPRHAESLRQTAHLTGRFAVLGIRKKN